MDCAVVFVKIRSNQIDRHNHSGWKSTNSVYFGLKENQIIK